jgi:hypothetical protein
MPKFKLVLFTAAALAAMSALAQPASAIEYPWCAQYSGGMDGGGRNCGFVTIEQCMATVSGVGGFCAPNLFYQGLAAEPPRRIHKHHQS